MPASHPMHTPTPPHEIRTQKAAIAVGTVFMLVGALGFVPGISRHGTLFAVFDVSTVQNLVHLAFGVAGLALARTFLGARRFLVVGGSTYLALSVYGLVVDQQGASHLRDASTWLHLGLAVAMIALGIGLSRTGRGVTPPAAT